MSLHTPPTPWMESAVRLGDPQRLSELGRPSRFVLYFHGGAFALCSSKSHRELIMRIVASTGAVMQPAWRRRGTGCEFLCVFGMSSLL